MDALQLLSLSLFRPSAYNLVKSPEVASKQGNHLKSLHRVGESLF